MLVKFLARGTGSARDAADYLLGERDATGKPREGVEVLRGDPNEVAAVADSVSEKTISDCYNITYMTSDQAITSLRPSSRTGIQSTVSEVLGPVDSNPGRLRIPTPTGSGPIFGRAAVPASTRLHGPNPSRPDG